VRAAEDTVRVTEQRDVELLSYHDLAGRPGIKIAMQEVEHRWYLYVGNLWDPGVSVLEVTDPAAPELLRFVEGPADTWADQVQVAEGRLIVGLERPVEGWMPDAGPDFEEGALIMDVRSDPADPTPLGRYRTGGTGTHRNFYAGGDHVFMTASLDGYQSYILCIVDISDVANPREISRWWWPGQHVGGGEEPEFDFYMHGPAYVVGDRAYLSYGRVGAVILDVSDLTKPELVSVVSFGGLGSMLGCHSVVPIPDRNLLVANSETILEGTGDPLNYAFVIDIADESAPKIISSLPMPMPSAGLPYRNYYEKGGRFGPHNQHHHQGHPDLFRPRDLLFLTYFNAGLRVFDLADPYAPAEVGYFVPDDPPNRKGPYPEERLVTQFEDVLVDRRGYAYCTDKNRGLFILRYRGELR
jgi:hypothetical protein